MGFTFMAAAIFSVVVLGVASVGLATTLVGVRRALGRAKGETAAILGAAADGIVTIDEKGRIETFNKAAERLFGYAAAEVEGRNVAMLMPEPYRGEHDGYLAAYHATNRPKVIGISREVEGCRKDGTTFPMDLAVGETQVGGKRLFAGIVRDVTVRKQTEDALRLSEATTRAILDTTVDGVITIDTAGRILSVNPSAERIFGYAVVDLVGQNVKILMPPPYHGAHDGYLRDYAATGQRKIIGVGREVQGRRKDGSVFPLDLSIGEAVVGGARIYTGIVRDITARRQTEEALRQSEERFRLIVDNVADYAIIWLDIDGRIASWNVGAERIYGWTAAEVVGASGEIFYPPEGRADAAHALAEVRSQGRYEGEGWRMRKDGSRFWVHTVITPLWDHDGAMRGFVRVSRNVTDRKRVDEDLRAAKDEAERANMAKSKFLAAASHDLRQPVQALVLFTAALESKMADSGVSPMLADLKGSLDALNVLLDSLLDVSRLDAGIVAPVESNVSVAQLLDRLAADFTLLAADKGIRLRMVATSAIVRTDPTLLGRVLQNLVANAVKYTKAGRILVGCRRRGKVLRVEVWDTGIGIAKDRFDDIFQEFYQVGNQERDRAHGLGLGLSIVQRLSRLLTCPVVVRSVVGKGSVFAMEVPLVGFNRAKNVTYLAGAGAGVAEPRAGKGLVFVIDDEVAVLKGLRLVIEGWGYDVLTATTEEEAVAALARQPRAPDIIIADYRLRAGRTGADAVRCIRALFGRAIPSIIITGDTAPERIREAEAHGLSILHKPVQPSDLRSVIADAVR